MADTSVTYTGDDATVNFSVPYPYILATHVYVYVNDIIRLDPSDYAWSDSATITFVTAPAQDDSIYIKRATPGDSRLVNFQNGAVLTEAELDMSANQNFYLAQEAKENYADLLNAEMVRIGTPSGITSTDPVEWIDSAIDTMLADATAAALQARVTDIDDNGQAIIDIAVRTTDMEAYYGVTLNVNGYITGFSQFNDGVSGSFVILADKFAIVDPSGDPAEPEFVPFSVAAGVVTMQNVIISGDLFVGGAISGGDIGTDAVDNTHIATNAVNADSVAPGIITGTEINGTNLSAIFADLGSITAGNITLDSSGYIKGGQTAYDTGSGFFLGYDTSAYKFSIGDGGANSMTWDGTTLTVRGDLEIGEYTASNTEILAANTERNSGVPGTFVLLKEFSFSKGGTVRVTFDAKVASTAATLPTSGTYEIRDGGGEVKASGTITTSGYIGKTHDVAMDVGDKTLEIWMKEGVRDTGSELLETASYIQNAKIKADITTNDTVVTD